MAAAKQRLDAVRGHFINAKPAGTAKLLEKNPEDIVYLPFT
jgi:hypothetical protein